MIHQISSFENGLDSRRSELTSKDHSLDTAVNVHINQGAEVEKRPAFVDHGTLPTNSFGLEATSAGMVVFGSAAQGSLNPALPSGVGYVRCQHPTNSLLAMTAILCSCSFGGYAWCAAQFSGGDVFLYYNGTIIPASVNGQVLYGGDALLDITTRLHDFIATDVFADQGINVGAVTANGLLYYFDVYASPGVSFNLTTPVLHTTALGGQSISKQLISSSSNGTPATTASFAFKVIAGNTGSLTSIYVSFDGGATFNNSILPTAVTWVADDKNGYATALDVAAAISSSLSAFLITANANNNQITIAADSSYGDDPNGYPVKINTSGDFCLDALLVDYSLTTIGALTSTSFLAPSLQVEFTGQTYGGGGTYVKSLADGTYFWHKGDNDAQLAVAGGSTFLADEFFTISGGPKDITLTGAAGFPVTAKVTLMVEVLNPSGVSGGSVTVTNTTRPGFVAAMAARIRFACVDRSLKYTACINPLNTSQLVVSRSEVRSDYDFYPVVATDVVGATSVTGTVVAFAPIIKLTHIPVVTPSTTVVGTNPTTVALLYTGIINVSVIGGTFPLEWFLNSDGSAANIAVYLPNGSTDTATVLANTNTLPYASNGSIMLTYLCFGDTSNQTISRNFVISCKDNIGNTASGSFKIDFKSHASGGGGALIGDLLTVTLSN